MREMYEKTTPINSGRSCVEQHQTCCVTSTSIHHQFAHEDVGEDRVDFNENAVRSRRKIRLTCEVVCSLYHCGCAEISDGCIVADTHCDVELHDPAGRFAEVPNHREALGVRDAHAR